MEWRNKRTGAVIDVKSELTGSDWEKVTPVSKPAPEKPKPAARKKGTAKK